MMTPLSVEALPTRPLGPRPAANAKRSWRGPAIAAGFLFATMGAVIARPPEALREFLKVYKVALPTAQAASRPAPSHPTTDSVMQAGLASPAPAISPDSGGRVATDSAAARALGADSLSPLGSRHAAMHLGAMGDSVGAGAAPGTQTAELDAKEVLMHVAKARELSRTVMLKGAGMELRTAYTEYRIFLTEHASAPQTAMLRQELQAAMDEGLAACRMARDSVAARGGPNFRCQHPAKTGILMDDSEDAAAAAPQAPPPAAPAR
jgi:hypothetical protein